MPFLGHEAGLREERSPDKLSWFIVSAVTLSDFPPSPVPFCLASSHEAGANEGDSTLPAVAEELLKEIKKAFQETSHGT